MISNLISSLNKKLQAVEISNRCRRTKKKTTYVYRDDLSKKKQSQSPSPSQRQPEIKKVKKRVRFAETEPVIIAIDGEERSAEEETEKKVVRITVKLTKQEANRMLSRCSDGGVLELGDVACELMRIPAARVSSSMAAN